MIMGEGEKEYFDKTYDYIKFNLLGYTKDMKVPNNVIFRLYGLACGMDYYRPPGGKATQNDLMPIIYSFKLIYSIFTIYNKSFDRVAKYDKYKDENHKINTIFLVLANNLNRLIKEQDMDKREQEKLRPDDTERLNKKIPEYESKSNIKDKFKELL